MMKTKLAVAGLFSVALLATPVAAQEATQEPGAMGFNYPNTNYLKGGYGHDFTPRPHDYYSGRASRDPQLRAAPYGYPADSYAYAPYGGAYSGWE